MQKGEISVIINLKKEEKEMERKTDLKKVGT